MLMEKKLQIRCRICSQTCQSAGRLANLQANPGWLPLASTLAVDQADVDFIPSMESSAPAAPSKRVMCTGNSLPTGMDMVVVGDLHLDRWRWIISRRQSLSQEQEAADDQQSSNSCLLSAFGLALFSTVIVNAVDIISSHVPHV
jgi:hypothetical protein